MHVGFVRPPTWHLTSAGRCNGQRQEVCVAYELALFESLQKSPIRKGFQTQGFLGEFKEGLLRTYLGERRPTSPLLSEVVDLALAFTAHTYDVDDKAALGNGVDRFVEKIETETRTIDVVLVYRERNKVALDALGSALINSESQPARAG